MPEQSRPPVSELCHFGISGRGEGWRLCPERCDENPRHGRQHLPGVRFPRLLIHASIRRLGSLRELKILLADKLFHLPAKIHVRVDVQRLIHTCPHLALPGAYRNVKGPLPLVVGVPANIIRPG